ncbi:MAG: hypothetical protein KQJ78_01400 [Deltaproteobacteria bacterium]|nr:hypothetical protein [Deltaproteobacteria bacterium]
MTKGGDTINQIGNTGQTVGKVAGDNYYHDPQVLLQALKTVRADIIGSQAPASQAADQAELVAKLDELVAAVRDNQPGTAKQAWAWLQNAVNVAVLPVAASQAWPVVVEAMHRLGS